MKTILILSVFIFSSLSRAQFTQEWVHSYNGTGDAEDSATAMAVSSNYVYVTGASKGSGGNYDYMTIKYGTGGALSWLTRYDGLNGDDIPEAITVDDPGNVYVSGKSNGTGAQFDIMTIKYNSSGVQQWSARYNGPGNGDDDVCSIVVDASGNVYVCGSAYFGIADFSDLIIIKYSSSGSQLWTVRYNRGYNDYGHSMTIDASGNLYAAGESWSGGGGSTADYVTIKYNSAGVQQWASLFNSTNNYIDIAYSIGLDGSGNVYVTGETCEWVTLNFDYATIKYNQSGVQQWVRTYNGTGDGNDQAYSLAVDGSGNVYVTGSSESISIGYDFATIKYNSSGTQQWVSRYGGIGNDFAHDLVLDASGNAYVAGERNNGSNDDYAVVKYNSTGVQTASVIYNGTGNGRDRAYAIGADASGNIYVTGESKGSSNFDFATLKYSQLTGINMISGLIPEKFSLEQNYPNPFNPGTIIRYSLPVNSSTVLKIYDILGEELETLVNEVQTPGVYEVNWDASGYPSGTYFCRIESESFTGTKKMLLVK